MKLFRFASTAALSFLMAGVLAAQSAPQSAPQSASPAPAAPRADQAATQARDAADITVVGCLAQAKDSADVYTLTVAPAAAAAPATAAGPSTSPNDATPATGNAKGDAAARAANVTNAAAAKPATYKIVGIAADQLKPHVNHQVELKGRIDAAPAAQAQDAASMREFRASSVKMINATCPAAK